jgi:hypothetical protein
VPVALVVGTVLSLVNQADLVLQGVAGAAVALLKVLANYAIPFLTFEHRRSARGPAALRRQLSASKDNSGDGSAMWVPTRVPR